MKSCPKENTLTWFMQVSVYINLFVNDFQTFLHLLKHFKTFGQLPRATINVNGVYIVWNHNRNLSCFSLHILYVLNKLCVVGGWSKDDPFCPVEQFCPQNNEWKMTAPMLHQRSDPGVCALGGAIYTLGGSDDVTCLSSVERWPFTSTSVIELSFKSCFWLLSACKIWQLVSIICYYFPKRRHAA